MINRLRQLPFISKKANWLGWFITTHLTLTFIIILFLIGIGVNPTLVLSVIAAPLWLAVAFTSRWITDKIMED